MSPGFARNGARFAGALALAALAGGCITGGDENRRLVVTEVGKRQVELALDESAGRAIKLGNGFVLSVRTSSGYATDIPLGAGGQTVAVGSLFIVWAQSGYTGPPVADPYPSGISGPVPGIRVAAGTFGDVDAVPSEVRLFGERERVSAMRFLFPVITTDHVDDVVRFGAPAGDRPATGGSFSADDSLANPSGSASLQRFWDSSGPVDTDAEADWTKKVSSWGTATPP